MSLNSLALAMQIAAIPAGAASMRDCAVFSYLITRLQRTAPVGTPRDGIVLSLAKAH